MLRFVKWLLIGLGIIVIVATAILMAWDIIQINQLVAVSNANKSNAAGFNANPRYWVLLAAGGALIGGLVLGVGLGLPRRTFKQRLNEKAAPAAAPAAPAAAEDPVA